MPRLKNEKYLEECFDIPPSILNMISIKKLVVFVFYLIFIRIFNMISVATIHTIFYSFF